MNEECKICKAAFKQFSPQLLEDCKSIIDVCLEQDSKNPIYIMDRLMSLPFCGFHSPEHHIMVGSALLTAYANAGGPIDKKEALKEMYNRGKTVPGSICAYWGACGAGISTGIYMSIITGSLPVSVEAWGLSNTMTSRSLGKIGEIGGPRCCKRDAYLAISEAVRFTAEKLGVQMELPDEIVCTRCAQNKQCIGLRCPFNPGNHVK